MKKRQKPQQKMLPMVLGLGFVVFSASGFLGWQSARAESAGPRLDVFLRQPNNEAALTQFAAVRRMLDAPRDARLWELEAVRLLNYHQIAPKLGLPVGSEAVRAYGSALRAIQLAPARPTLRMRAAFASVAYGGPDDELNQRIQDWHAVAPHHGATQAWRLALAVRQWDRLTPQSRALILADSEDVCVRSGARRTLELVRQGADSAYFAISSRLARMTRTCTVFPSTTGPILN
jgi:hypothetical protein